MEKRYWFVIKDNYIIDYVIWDGVTPWVYPLPHDLIKEDNTFQAGIGDWYEASEDIFYRPIGKTPPDFPGNP